MKSLACRFGAFPVALLATGVWLSPRVSHAAPDSPAPNSAPQAAPQLDADRALFSAAAQAAGLRKGEFPGAWNDLRAALDNGAQGRYRNATGETALFLLGFAVKNFDEATAKRVIEVSDVNAQDKNGNSALAAAAQNGNEKLVALLIAKGAALSRANKRGYTPLDGVDEKQFPAVVALLRQAGAKTSPPRTKGKTFDHALDGELRAAVKAQNSGEVRELLARGADPNLKDTDAYATPLLAVASSDKFDIRVVQALLDAGADKDARSSQGATAVALSVVDGHLDIMSVLLDAGADIEAATTDGLRPLMLAAATGESETVRILLERGAQVNARSLTNGTALIYGSSKSVGGSGRIDIVKRLVEAGGDIYVKATNDKDALGTAAANDLAEINNFLVDCWRRDARLFSAASQSAGLRQGEFPGALNDLRQALDEGAGGYYRGAGGETALILLSLAVKDFDEVIARRVIAVSDINAQNKNGDAAIAAAAQSGNEKMVALLIEKGASLSQPDKSGHLPLDYADATKYPGLYGLLRKAGAKTSDELKENGPKTSGSNTTVSLQTNLPKANTEATTALLKMLAQTPKPFDFKAAAVALKSGADVNGQDVSGATCLALACRNCAPDVVAWLLKQGAKPDIADLSGFTALMWAGGRGSGDDALSITSLLIAAGANLNLKNQKGDSAEVIARQSFNSRAADALVKAGAITIKEPAAPPAATPDDDGDDTFG